MFDEKLLHQLAEEFPVDEPDFVQVEAALDQALARLGLPETEFRVHGTPRHVADMLVEVLSGYRTDPLSLVQDSLFEGDFDQLVLVGDIPFYSMCQHHLLPFFGKAQIAYLPGRRIIGLGKIPRILDLFARRLQTQERLTEQVAKFLRAALQPKGVAVVLEGTHLCAAMRGVQKNPRLTTSVMLGAFHDDARLHADFLAALGRQRGVGSVLP